MGESGKRHCESSESPPSLIFGSCQQNARTVIWVGWAALLELARGRDDRPVTPDREAKTISSETTFAADIDDRETLKSWLVVWSSKWLAACAITNAKAEHSRLKFATQISNPSHVRSRSASQRISPMSLWQRRCRSSKRRVRRTDCPYDCSGSG